MTPGRLRRRGQWSAVIGGLLVGLVAMLLPTGAGTASAAPGFGSSEAWSAAPGTEGLTPQLRIAYTLAAREAAARGVPLHIVSGKRSVAEQEVLWQRQLTISGSAAEARKWALPPAESTHVTGEAIDVGPRAGAEWLQATGHRWGLCRSFANEWWHFELGTLPGTRCPAPLPHAGMR